jgi:F-type H+-transporting ATPase subunit a
VSSDQVTTPAPVPAPAATDRRRVLRRLGLLVVAVIVLDILAVIFLPPFPLGGTQGDACAYPTCYITGTLELPPPHTVIDLDPANPLASGSVVIGFHPSITSTILTMWIVMLILLVLTFAATRGMKLVPNRLQNLIEFAYEGLENFGIGMGGIAAKPYIPLFAAFFLLILFCNWSGLVPPVGKIEELRAPTSDVNITLGLALVSFGYFEFQGFRRHGVRGYLGRFFPLYEFRNGIGAGIIAMFVGLIELMLEFVKPVTLSMRLFGNIYGGEVALAAITALTLFIAPVLLFGLEVMLNFIQALIFSILSLMFIVLAIESHGDEEGELGHEAIETLEHVGPGGQPIGA